MECLKMPPFRNSFENLRISYGNSKNFKKISIATLRISVEDIRILNKNFEFQFKLRVSIETVLYIDDIMVLNIFKNICCLWGSCQKECIGIDEKQSLSQCHSEGSPYITQY